MKFIGKIWTSAASHRKFLILFFTLAGLAAAGWLLSLNTAFADFWTDNVYPIICRGLTAVTGRLPFALGEVLMYLGALLVLLVPLLGIICIFLRKKKGYTKFYGGYMRTFACICGAVLLVYTTNWLIPYRSSVMGRKDFVTGKKYTSRELRVLYFYIVDNLNESCRDMPRDEEGTAVFHEKAEAEKLAGQALNDISHEFPRLKGSYPPIKEAFCSDVLDWMWIGGFTYPYTMETTMNKYTDRMYFPTLYAHESAHHMGYYKEHEANFISYLACSQSDDVSLRYSAYSEMYDYVFDAYFTALIAENADDSAYEEIDDHPVMQQYFEDLYHQSDLVAEVYNEDDHALEEYSDVAADAAEVGWETQSEVLEEYDYDYVVTLLLEYYDGVLY